MRAGPSWPPRRGGRAEAVAAFGELAVRHAHRMPEPEKNAARSVERAARDATGLLEAVGGAMCPVAGGGHAPGRCSRPGTQAGRQRRRRNQASIRGFRRRPPAAQSCAGESVLRCGDRERN